MTAAINQYSLISDCNPVHTSASPLSNEISGVAPSLYLGPGYTNIPGIINLMFSPRVFCQGVKAAYRAFKIGDREGIFENVLRILQVPVDMGNALMQSGWYLLSTGLICEGALKLAGRLSKFIMATGLLFCAIEGMLEGMGLAKSVKFDRRFYPKIDSLEDKENIYLSALLKLKTFFFEVSPEEMQKIDTYVRNVLPNGTSDRIAMKINELVTNLLEAKKNRLIRRMYPRLAADIENSLPRLVTDLQSSVPDKIREAAAKASALFENIRIQSQKKQLLHIVGLLAIMITVVGILTGAWPALLVGSILAMVRYCMHLGLMDSKGWHFCVENCTPAILRKIHEKLFSKKLIQPILIDRNQLTYSFPNSLYEKNCREFEKTLSRMNFRIFHDRGDISTLSCGPRGSP